MDKEELAERLIRTEQQHLSLIEDFSEQKEKCKEELKELKMVNETLDKNLHELNESVSNIEHSITEAVVKFKYAYLGVKYSVIGIVFLTIIYQIGIFEFARKLMGV